VLGDLQGPKIRLGTLPDDGVELVDGAEVVLLAGGRSSSATTTAPGRRSCRWSTSSSPTTSSPGALVLMDDGLLRLVVSRSTAGACTPGWSPGGLAKSRKGVNLPGVEVSAKSLTDKDREDVAAMVAMEVDWVALSFVRRPEDVREVRDLVRHHGGQAPIVAKLERPEAVDNLEAIVTETDAVMVARGDLGVEIGPERVPACRRR
jgi:pyruvate kinase